MSRTLLLAVLSLSVLFSPLVAAQDASYIYTIIKVPGATSTRAQGINDHSQIVGSFGDGTGRTYGFLTDGATFTTIEVPGATATFPSGINDDGQIVGSFIDGTGRVYGFLKDGATFTTIEVPGATSTNAQGINDDGQIVGSFGDGTGRVYGFLKDGATFTTIEVPGATATFANGINTVGQIVGAFNDAAENDLGITAWHGFLIDGATFSIIEIPGALETLIYGINDRGQLVGYVIDAVEDNQGFVTDRVTFTIINVPGATSGTFPFGINTVGQIVGWSPLGDSFLATPVDTTPPIITIAVNPATLSPPNGKLIPVTVSGTITDELGGSGVQAGSTGYRVIDEYGQMQPSGSFTLDADGRYAFTVALQASRNAKDKDGRRYTITVSATDHAGNEGATSATVTVPRK